ncbi:3beta-hydroxysteroid dehydrogenase/Delta(5)-Delta(4) isomerase 1 [Caenorhabditis elegans]|uniref:3beta-hydroxysteroid dehydrogenase/Delta(5)-Delta(4) isomerase 1 n=1 Tax=Caenorhabditis elegans TaxID=6239 RepID=HSD3B_CAEEL|nr:3beta-hydroxysteroid dehydrogenase/Delta(5)-Delta(4) isomerase 1 [Caenorhabditis elegans]Q9XWF0.1 RecName: Full=3beta-hydroxysteroid dehydrogenase/Delta(5)-Delta(4) isomerase 1; Short=HSD-1; AltName: Full=3beta_HSD domain-containing protein 1 [Caenorhabditis elegans]CAA21722.1 3beta-hydroxysteroid dehydrogenase/Delta(5)-Delta(4) isomerase 1 [Caenorhabditis elegans]|eukprot:NP_493402.1 HydroxySteroid Dehydrogenase homolog [Caenorhabditis elegans]
MSIKRLSMRLKKGIHRSWNRMTSLEAGLEEEKEIKIVEEPEPRPWKVLITGGAGHLAENLVAKLEEMTRDSIRPKIREMLEKEMPAVISTKVDKEVEKRLPMYIQIVLVDVLEPRGRVLKHHVAFVKCSFDDECTMKTALEQVDTVYHLAAVGMTGQYARDRKACMDINAVGTMNLLIWARNSGVQRFIYTSSVGVVFSGEPMYNATEEVGYPDDFYNYYCESKAHAERIVQKASGHRMRTTVLRFNGIYGPGEKRVTERVVKFMLTGMWIATCKPNGVEAQTQLSSVANCIQGLVKAELALRWSDTPHGQIYNIMDKTPVGTFSFWTPLNIALGFSSSMITVPATPIRLFAYLSQIIADRMRIDPIVSVLEVDLLLVNNTFNIEKAERDLGYEPSVSAIPEIIEHYLHRLPPDVVRPKGRSDFYVKVAVLVLGTILIFVAVFSFTFWMYLIFQRLSRWNPF